MVEVPLAYAKETPSTDEAPELKGSDESGDSLAENEVVGY